MRKVNWKSRGSSGITTAKVGFVSMTCSRCRSKQKNGKTRWFADVSTPGWEGVFRVGPMRYSIAKAQDDAIRLARETMFDYQACLDAELKKWE